jgi:heptosyltransferase-2
MKKFLIIQTAFIGDVILATPVVEKLKSHYPDAQIDFLLRNGNERLLENNPHINRIYALDKKRNKFLHVQRAIGWIRANRYDHLINLQRFFTTGLISFLSGAKEKSGFDKNPFSFSYDYKVPHDIGTGKHEIERNIEVVAPITDGEFVKPRLYPSAEHYNKVSQYQMHEYLCIAPASVWFTKQFPRDKWVKLLDKLDRRYIVYLIGGPEDFDFCHHIIQETSNKDIYNLCGKLNFLETAALMKSAVMNYVNDSAPLHIASAMNAPVTAIFCSTVPRFGFYPVSEHSRVVEIDTDLYCRPCGLHGFKACPEGHFKCAREIDVNRLII